MGFSIGAPLAEDRRRARPQWSAGAVSPAIAPFAYLGDELQVAEELVVDEIIIASQAPEEVRPAGVYTEGELGAPG